LISGEEARLAAVGEKPATAKKTELLLLLITPQNSRYFSVERANSC
jgi:hypothetical protein